MHDASIYGMKYFGVILLEEEENPFVIPEGHSL
jgi:hypothetical protein